MSLNSSVLDCKTVSFFLKISKEIGIRMVPSAPITTGTIIIMIIIYLFILDAAPEEFNYNKI